MGEPVNEGHPDKLCDKVSDAVLDACLAQDPESKVACETCSKTGMVMVFGEITTKAKVNYEEVVRQACLDIGFDAPEKGLDGKTCKVLVHLEEQSQTSARVCTVWEPRSLRRSVPVTRATCLAMPPMRPQSSCHSHTFSPPTLATSSPKCSRTAPAHGFAQTVRPRSPSST